MQALQFTNPFSLLSLQGDFTVRAEDFEYYFQSNFEKRCACLDINKQGFNYLFEKESDYLVVDLLDARADMLKKDEHYISIFNFVKLNRKNLDKDFGLDKYDTVSPYDDITDEQWNNVIDTISGKILEKYSPDRVIINEFYGVESYAQDGLLKSFNKDVIDRARKYNTLVKRLYERLEQNLQGCHIISFPDFTISKNPHRFGVCSLHYNDTYYNYGAKALELIMQKLPLEDEKGKLEELRTACSEEQRRIFEALDKPFEQADIICELAKPKIKGRKIALLYFKTADKATIETKFFLNDVNIDCWIDESPTAKNAEFVRKDLAKKAKEYYVIIWKAFDNNIFRWFADNGYNEIADFIFYTPQAINLSGNMKSYSDIYGNIIKNLPANVKVTLKGYLSRVEFGRDVAFGGGSSLAIDSKAKITVAAGAKFGENSHLEAESLSTVKLGKKSFGRNAKIIARLCSNIFIDDGRSFVGDSFIVVSPFHELIIGKEALFAVGLTIRCGDAHALFDVVTKQKKNFNDDKRKNKIVIGDHVWIGAKGTILAPTYMGSGCTVGATALVKGTYPNNCVIGGVPAKVLRRNSAWHHEPYSLLSQIDGSYAIPTVEIAAIKEEKLKIRNITDIYQYLDMLKEVKDKLIAIAVKDTTGQFIDEKITEKLHALGLTENLQKLLQYAYIAVINDEAVIFERLAQEQNTPLVRECTADGIKVKALSRPYKCGNKSEIIINGYNYSTNTRGLDIVLFDKESKQLVDSVGFDCHAKGMPITRKITLF